MKKQQSMFGITAEEELDLKHQGSIGGQQVVSKAGRMLKEGMISSLDEQRKGELSPGRQASAGPDVAMTSSSQPRPERGSSEAATESPELAKHAKKHHYKK